MRQPCRVSSSTGECELTALPSVMLLLDSPLLKRLSEGQQGRRSRENKLFLSMIFAFQGTV